jgi:hypothetical protein
VLNSAFWPLSLGENNMQTMATLMIFLLAAPPQRIETQYPDRTKITRVETAMNHLTVIELAEPVTLAAAGSPSFKIERRDNKVFIQPLEEGVSTNLFIWTGSGRWNYELVPAASVETMHFAVDQQIAASSEIQQPGVSPADSASSHSFAEEMLLFGKPIRNVGVKFGSRQVGVFITDAYRKDDRLFVRYMIDNRTTHPFAAVQPEVFSLQSPHSQTSLRAYRYSQLGPEFEKKILSRTQTKIATVECDVPSEPLPAGEVAIGILILEAPPTASANEPAVLRFVFPAAGQKATSLTLIL